MNFSPLNLKIHYILWFSIFDAEYIVTEPRKKGKEFLCVLFFSAATTIHRHNARKGTAAPQKSRGTP